jgi:hypothetical protein
VKGTGWLKGLEVTGGGTGVVSHAGPGPGSLVLYDVSTRYFETDAGDGFREAGFRGSGGWGRRSRPAC